jgi:hypothetical protein
VRVTNSFVTYQFRDSGYASYIDSNFYFYNCSDTGYNITYSWDFGDGTTSVERDPVHKYARRGNFQVTLVVSNNNMAYDTARKNVRVALGEKYISLGNEVDTYPVAMEETAGNEFVLLGATGAAASFYLIQMDSLLKQKNVTNFPSGYRFTSMQPTTDGHFIFTGTTQAGSKTNELIKIKADGTLLWHKTLSNDIGYNYAAQTPDGGYAVLGTKTITAPNNLAINVTVVNKTDNNGNQQWQKVFDNELLIKTSDAVIEQDGIVLAGAMRKYSYSLCSTCDSLTIFKMNFAGDIIWKSTMLWGLNTYDLAGTHTMKLSNGNYAVLNDTTRAIYYFDGVGHFVDRILSDNRIVDCINSADGKLVTLQQSYQSNYLQVAKLGLDGVAQWSTTISGYLKINGYFDWITNRPIAIRRLRNGGTLTIGTWNVPRSGYRGRSDILLVELDEAGVPK